VVAYAKKSGAVVTAEITIVIGGLQRGIILLGRLAQYDRIGGRY
jgi:hypothetical protein